MTRARLRDLGITIGTLPTGEYNAITDVPGVRVGHCTLIYDEPRIARTGVTLILPREEAAWDNQLFAGFHVLNGNGDFTGTHWLEEAGLLTTPIAITNTHQVGVVRARHIPFSNCLHASSIDSRAVAMSLALLANDAGMHLAEARLSAR